MKQTTIAILCGGGVWLAPLVRTNTLSFSVAASKEDVLFYLRAGFHY